MKDNNDSLLLEDRKYTCNVLSNHSAFGICHKHTVTWINYARCNP